MKLEELKQYKDGVCFGYSTIGYLLKNVFPFNDENHEHLKFFKEYADSKVYPIVMYYKNEDGNEGILCRPMIYSDNLLKPLGILQRNVNPNGIPKYEQIAYVAKTVKMPLDIDLDSIYEYKREPIVVKG